MIFIRVRHRPRQGLGELSRAVTPTIEGPAVRVGILERQVSLPNPFAYYSKLILQVFKNLDRSPASMAYSTFKGASSSPPELMITKCSER